MRPRRSDPWFDPECRAAKRLCRQLERRARRSAADSDTVAAWHNQLRDYRALLDRKRTAFWTNTIEALQYNPRRMWRVIDDLLGRVDCVTGNTSLTADKFCEFFDTKVAGVMVPLLRPLSPPTPSLRRAVSSNVLPRSASRKLSRQ